MSQSPVTPALWGTREGEEYLHNLAATRLQPLPAVSTEELTSEETGYGPRVAEMHMKGMISVSPDSRIFPYKEKCYIT